MKYFLIFLVCWIIGAALNDIFFLIESRSWNMWYGSLVYFIGDIVASQRYERPFRSES